MRRSNGGLPGVAVAGMTAVISGLSVFVNSYGVHAVASPSVYTTAKNLVATLVLATCALVAWRVRTRQPSSPGSRFVAVTEGARPAGATRQGGRTWGVARLAGLAYVGVVGGGIAFVLFFNGLAQTSATPAAFWRDTLVIWVAVMALPFLRERVTWWNIAAIGLLIVGQVSIAGGVGSLVATAASCSSSQRRCCGRSRSSSPSCCCVTSPLRPSHWCAWGSGPSPSSPTLPPPERFTPSSPSMPARSVGLS